MRNKGITLIALIITIIVLLILAGVALASLSGENGLLSRSSQAKEEAVKAQLKEEIEMAIMDIQAEEVPKGNNVTLESLAGEAEEDGQLEKHKDLQKGNITAVLGEGEITGEYKDYDYTIDGNLNVEIGGKITSAKPEITYSLSTDAIDATEVTITVTATVTDGTIIKITKPDGSVVENTNTTTYTANKSGSYTFKAESSTGRKATCTVKVMNIKPSTPEIKVVQQGGYPVLTSNGFIDGGSIIEIKYDDSTVIKNYYKEDEGDWKEYKGQIRTSATNIEAKSVIKVEGKDNLESNLAKTTLSNTIPSDSLKLQSYDENKETEETYNLYSTKAGCPYYYFAIFDVDESTWGKYLDIIYESNYWNGGLYSLWYAFYNEQDTLIGSTVGGSGLTAEILEDKVVCIPQNTKKVLIATTNNYYFDLYEVGIYSMENDELIPKMTSNSQDGVTVSVSSVSEWDQAYYAVDGDETTKWRSHRLSGAERENQFFEVEFDQPVIVKSYYLYGLHYTSPGWDTYTFRFQASNDNSKWVDFDGGVFSYLLANGRTKFLNNIENNTRYKYYRFYCENCPSYWEQSYHDVGILYEFQLFGIK